MATSEPTERSETPQTYEQLIERFTRISDLEDVSMQLHWDQQVMMPEGGSPARSQQLSTISATEHELLVDQEVAEWLDELDTTELTDLQAANVREIQRQHERKSRIPTALNEKIAQTTAENQQIWQEAKANDDFDSFAPRLERLRELQHERASHIAPDRNPYEVLLEDAHPYISLSTIEEIFETLREEIPPLISKIEDADRELAAPFEGEYPESDQRGLCEAALDFLGYDWNRGRLDTAPHPFMIGNQFDARVTTRFKPTDPIDALTATIHEMGHATYQHGLPKDRYGTPAGTDWMSIHESQSRFWENHIGRTKPFWETFLPEIREHLGEEDLTPQQLYETANRVRPDNLIRVEADELTYHMHIILRAEIDRAFVEGEIDAAEIPQRWNDKMEQYLGVRPDTDSEGCLQDIHWTNDFANFQTYTIGSVLAAQLDAAIRDDLAVDQLIREENFEPIHEWMTEQIHQHGQRYTPPELIERATGEPLTAEYFVEYVHEKFETLYDL